MTIFSFHAHSLLFLIIYCSLRILQEAMLGSPPTITTGGRKVTMADSLASREPMQCKQTKFLTSLIACACQDQSWQDVGENMREREVDAGVQRRWVWRASGSVCLPAWYCQRWMVLFSFWYKSAGGWHFSATLIFFAGCQKVRQEFPHFEMVISLLQKSLSWKSGQNFKL